MSPHNEPQSRRDIRNGQPNDGRALVAPRQPAGTTPFQKKKMQGKKSGKTAADVVAEFAEIWECVEKGKRTTDEGHDMCAPVMKRTGIRAHDMVDTCTHIHTRPRPLVVHGRRPATRRRTRSAAEERWRRGAERA